MIKKQEKCLYCGEKMDSKRASKKFCSEQHRLYYWREKRFLKGNIKSFDELTTVTHVFVPKNEHITIYDGEKIEPSTSDEPKKWQEIPSIPIREKGEDAFDFAQRKNEWKLKYNQK